MDEFQLSAFHLELFTNHFLNFSLIQTVILQIDTYFCFVFSYVCVHASVCVGRGRFVTVAASASHRAGANFESDVNVFMEIYKATCLEQF